MMTRLMLSLVLLVLGAASAFATQVERVTSPGGIEAWLVREDAIPLVSMNIAFEGGARLDPAGREELATVSAAMLNEGAGPYDAGAFKRELEAKAIRFGASADLDTIYVSVAMLAEHRARAFELLGLALNAPRFDKAPFERLRAQMQAVLKQESEDPDTLAARAWYSRVFPGHPYGRSENGSPQSIASLKPAEAKSFLGARMTRDRLKIAVVGDITAEELAPLLDTLFGKLPATGPAETVAAPAFSDLGKTQIIEIDNPQSRVIFGGEGLARKDPDYMAAVVMNYILGGGGFSSRLMDEVREKRGLAYGVSTDVSPLRHVGLFMGSVGTDNAKVAEALALIKSEIERLRKDGPTDEELANAKTYLTGSFALRLDSNAKIANFLLACQLYDLGIDYIDRRNAEIEAVTREDVVRVAERLLHADRLAYVVVGKPQGLVAN
ncbi:MAG: insulinase family protein [Alphaproteobacteria bacterium]|nr:insulinase family protein [Alphaproteobacteria bacterium]